MDPYSRQTGARLYKTGDRVRFLPDGNIEFLGRWDQQVKIRGFRLELGEIESVLNEYPAIASGVVLVRNQSDGDQTLLAYVVARESAEISVDSLRSWLGERLPEFMLPAAFVCLPAFPLTPNGKVDRQALAQLEGLELVAKTHYVAPRNQLERQLVEIWQTVLRRDRVGIQDNFFDLGGHSLHAVAMLSRLTRVVSGAVPLRLVFEHPTIERLATQIESRIGPAPTQILTPIEVVDRQTRLPMSFAQQGMWLLQQLLPDSATYHVPVACRLSGKVDRDRVRRALLVLVERHEVLRTALVHQEGTLVQQVAAAAAVPLPWQEVDFSAVPSSRRATLLTERLVEEARRPFDLARAPLWRTEWIELAEAEQVLAFTFHHSIVDEWSLRLFFAELQQLCGAEGNLEPARLPELPIQYADYAAWQRQRLSGELLEQQRAYWREQLQDLPPALELATDRPRPNRPSGRGAVHAFQLTGPVVTQLRELRAKKAPPCSRCCWPPSRFGCIAIPARRTWWWARPSPSAIGRRCNRCSVVF